MKKKTLVVVAVSLGVVILGASSWALWQVPSVRCVVVGNVPSGDARLYKIVLNDADAGVRRAALDKLSDQAFLEHISFASSDPAIRQAAAEKLTGQDVLAGLILRNDDLPISRIAVKKLTDQSRIAEAAIVAKDAEIRRTALDKLSDPEAQAKVAMDSPNAADRLEVAGKLADAKLLSKLAAESADPAVRKAAVEKISDKALLVTLTTQAKDPAVRKVAVDKIDDLKLLVGVAASDDDASVRHAAARKLTDRAALGHLAASADERLRENAATALKVFDACASLPAEQRTMLSDCVRDVVHCLGEKEIATEVGGIETVAITCITASAVRAQGGMKTGDMVTISIKLRNLARVTSHTWVMQLPQGGSSDGNKSAFGPLAFNPSEMLNDLFNGLPQDYLSRIAIRSADAEVRQAAVRKLVDQNLLADISAKDTSPRVREAAKARLNALGRAEVK